MYEEKFYCTKMRYAPFEKCMTSKNGNICDDFTSRITWEQI